MCNTVFTGDSLCSLGSLSMCNIVFAGVSLCLLGTSWPCLLVTFCDEGEFLAVFAAWSLSLCLLRE